VEIMTADIVTRRAGLTDLDALLHHVAAGFHSYAAFASPGWQPPLDVHARRDWEADVLADPATWALLALAGGLAHLWQLFVLPDWWGRGVAPRLHDAAIDEMRARGYVSARLFTPSQHARARRFYERRGWIAEDEAFNEDLALPLTEYRLVL
jgi:GNAT superfamily N-acetyltransferase